MLLPGAGEAVFAEPQSIRILFLKKKEEAASASSRNYPLVMRSLAAARHESFGKFRGASDNPEPLQVCDNADLDFLSRRQVHVRWYSAGVRTQGTASAKGHFAQ